MKLLSKILKIAIISYGFFWDVKILKNRLFEDF